MITGPLAGMLLADLGASVIKIENRESGDPFRKFHGGLYSAHFLSYNRNKRSLTLDLRSAKGKEIFVAKCALCHGEKGDGKGPGAVNLPLKPADLTDGKMVAEMPDNFWVWRVSEGGLVEPFKSKGSVMPAWKGDLSMNDRWAVTAYAHTLSGHRGPHVVSEHPELKPKPKFVTGEGTVTAVRPEKQQIVLDHAEIKGFMEAMTMGYKATPISLLTSVKPGDKVRFTIDTDARAITKIDKVPD